MEKEEKETKKSKNKKERREITSTPFQTTLLVGLLICTSALGGWVVGASKVATNVNAKRNNYVEGTSKINDNKNNESNKENNSVDNTSNNEQEENTVEPEEIKPIDLSKSLNSKNIDYTNVKELTEDTKEIGLSIKNDGETVKLVVDYNEFGQYTTSSGWGLTVEEYEIRNLSGKVKSTYVSGIGQDYTGTMLFFLMEDGSVEYIRVYKKATNSRGYLDYLVNFKYEKNPEDKNTPIVYLESQGKVNGVKDVVNLYSASACYKSESDIPSFGGHGTTLASTKDGSFYDLAEIID